MNRRNFLASVAALPATALFPEVLSQSEQQITHVDTKTGGALLQSSVVKAEGILPEGAAPGARAYVEFNGPTEQLAGLASGFVTLEPGAQRVQAVAQIAAAVPVDDAHRDDGQLRTMWTCLALSLCFMLEHRCILSARVRERLAFRET